MDFTLKRTLVPGVMLLLVASCGRSDLDAVRSVSVSPSSIALLVGGVEKVQASVDGSGGVDWTASGGFVDEAGFYHAPMVAGSYRVIATSQVDQSVSGSMTVEVHDLSVTIDASETEVLTGQTLQFSASVTGWTDQSVTWSSSGGVIDQRGHFTAPSLVGVYSVTATSRADSRRSAIVAVRVGEIVLTVGPQGAAALTQGQLQFSATTGGWRDGSVVWSTTGGEVDANGLFVAPVTPGRYTITAHSVADPSKFASAEVIVSRLAIAVAPASPEVLTGQHLRFTAAVSGWFEAGVTWTASGGTVDSTGLYTAPGAPGVQTVTATSTVDPTRSASAAVVVCELALGLAPSSMVVAPGAQRQLTVSVSGWPDQSVTWGIPEGYPCGSVTSSGLYTGPESVPAFACHATVVSIADSTKTASTAITVAPQTYPDAGIANLQMLLGTPILGGSGATLDIRSYFRSILPVLSVPADLASWQQDVTTLRKRFLDQVVFAGRAAEWRDAPARVEWLEWIDGGPGYRIRKLRYEALPGLWIPGLLYMPSGLSGPAPAMLHPVGHSPEGKAEADLQARCINLAKRGVIGLSFDWYWTGQLGAVPDVTSGFTHGLLHQISLSGASGMAPFYLALTRAIDALEMLPEVDANRIGVSGHSGGAWQAIWLAALDPRIAIANTVAGFSPISTCMDFYKDIGDFEELPVDMGTVGDFTHLAAMVAPRPLLLVNNAYDTCCFGADHALQPVYEAAMPAYQVHGVPDSLRTYVNYIPGTHNFERDNREQLYRFVGDYFFPGDPSWDPIESSPGEIKTGDQLKVDLPAAQVDFRSLAQNLAATLPPRAPTALRIAKVIRSHFWDAESLRTDAPELAGEVVVRRRTFRIGSAWTLPAVEVALTGAREDVILMADTGRAGAAAATSRLLLQGKRVLVIDPFAFGESQMPGAFLMALTSGVGERPLGLASSQVAAMARLLRAERGGVNGPAISAVGPQTSVVALLAAVLEPAAVGAVEVEGSLISLKSLIDSNPPPDAMLNLWTYGLAAETDLAELEALLAPRAVVHR
jgi:hypothetical protein